MASASSCVRTGRPLVQAMQMSCGVEKFVELTELLAVEVVEPHGRRGRVGVLGEVPRLGLERVEPLLDVGGVGVNVSDAGLGVGDSLGGGLRPPGGGVMVAEAGAPGVVVGRPHGRPKPGAEVVFDLGDRVGVGLPGRPGGGECRLEFGELGRRLGPAGRLGRRGCGRGPHGAVRAGRATGRPSRQCSTPPGVVGVERAGLGGQGPAVESRRGCRLGRGRAPLRARRGLRRDRQCQ